ncbi:ABC transporter ATP-binding protein [Methanoculleus sp. FWC-SCC1]|uniref:Molybdate/tungstate import ATP-binding protein WtpC n=1 Tax=Methanoculleus frigidifontis TaxID=2584085 RepID=A0ABT8MCD4_9EURY|nr:ABC transporter ATP-binding protein [Methanoculleus sp. FWC-SCC1]MDN7025596.1 ABC transporter ATP-binding protein [Methanoculleus sp. FWC-SCC1]
MIEFDRVSLSLGQFALKDVSLTINEGDYYFIVGPSGAGKTVMLEAIAGLHQPGQGRVLLRGEDITATPPEKRRIGLVYQDYSLFPHMTVSDNIAFGLRLQGAKADAVRREVDALLRQFGIEHLAERHPLTLSGGEQQRVALARSIAVKPDILLLDEPLSALDPVTREKFMQDLARLHRERHLTVVQVSHERSEARRLGTRMAVIIDGRLVAEDRVATVLNAPKRPDVARFVGIENVLEGCVVENAGGLAVVDVAGLRFEAVTGAAPGERVSLCIRGQDVGIALSENPASSSRNALSGTVAGLVGNGPLVDVRVDCGVAINALLTERSVEELGIRPGSGVVVLIKASAIHVIAGDAGGPD